LAASGTSTVSATETDNVSRATRHPRPNIVHGCFSHRSCFETVAALLTCGSTRSSMLNDTRITPRPTRKSAQPGTLADTKSTIGPQSLPSVASILADACQFIPSSKPPRMMA
jgi:hypothetical protein